MELLTELVQINEGKIVDRRLLGKVEKIFKRFDPKAVLNKMHETKSGRFRAQFEGEVDTTKILTPGRAKPLASALEKLAFDELVESGQTVMGVEVEPGFEEGQILFIIELDQD